MTQRKPRVVVAMSGGVDSSVAAALLVEQGHEVIGMMLRLWSEPGMEAFNRCCTPQAMGLARQVAAVLSIPFYVLDVRQPFRERVVQYFINGYAQGITPNPCLVCNRHIRFGFLLQRARSLGAEFLATGHYARLRRTPDGTIQLLRGVDSQKDQSYVLSVLNQEQLNHALFPVGAYTKSEVRQLAQQFHLPVADRTDSQDLCFLAGEDYRDFLRRHAPETLSSGPIVNRQGELLGQHRGLAFYTIGQRKGLGIAAPQPLYVLTKDIPANTLVVGRKEEMGQDELTAERVNWVAGSPPEAPFRAQVKIRYTARMVEATVTPLNGELAHVRFDSPLRDITPGQAAVFYDGEVCLGGGIIRER